MLEENIDNLTGNIHGALIDTAAEVFGNARKKKRPWICATREEASRKEEKMTLAMQNNTQVNKEIRRRMKEAKETWIPDRCKEIDSGIRTGNRKALSTF